MVCVDELIATSKRLELLFNNTDNPEEKLATKIILENLTNLIKQISEVIKTPQFKEMIKE